MIAYLFSKLITMVYGMLYPAYCSYKAVKTKDVKEYVHWMMYWIVFSIFSFFEVFADTFIGCWFPFYYELKILFMIWMLSPSTRGGSILYRRLIHPSLTRHEPEIDAYLAEFKLRTSSLLVQWGSRAFGYVTDFVMHTALRAGAGDYRFMNMNKMPRTYSYEDFDQPDMNRNSHQQRGDLSPGSTSDADYPPFASQSQALARPRKMYSSDVRYGSMEENLGQFGDASKPYSMMNLADDSESQQPPRLRSSSRKKKEFGNYSVVTAEDMSMPLVFGWYPPNMTSPLMSPSFPHQDLSEIPLSMRAHERSDLLLPTTSVHWVENSEEDTDSNVETDISQQVSAKEVKELESDSFFDCESDQEAGGLKSVTDEKDGAGTTLKPNVKVVSKTVLQGFEEDNDNTVKLRSGSLKSDENAQKRNSMSAINKISKSRTLSPQSARVKKSLSNSDIKLTKAPILSSSSFRRVFSLSSPKPIRSRRSGSDSKASSTASLNVEKDKPK